MDQNSPEHRFLNRHESREVDRRAIEEFGMSGLVLMENAGRSCADWLAQRQRPGAVTIFCGKGNNGGDGFVIARHLQLRSFQVAVILCAPPAEICGDAGDNLEIIKKAGLEIRPIQETSPSELTKHIRRSNWCIDALLGTGARGEPRPPIDTVIKAINQEAPPTLAIDLPSGLDCDTGVPASPTIRATATCTLVAPKAGFQSPAAKPWLGEVHVMSIGIPRQLLAELIGARHGSGDSKQIGT